MSEKVELYAHNLKPYMEGYTLKDALKDCREHFLYHLAYMFVTEADQLHKFDLRRQSLFNDMGKRIKIDSDTLIYKETDYDIRPYCELEMKLREEKMSELVASPKQRKRLKEFAKEVGNCFGPGEFPWLVFNIVDICGTPYMFYNLVH